MARKTLRSLNGIAKGRKKGPMAKLIHTQVLDILYVLCWLNLYTNSIAKGRRSREGLQAIAFILHSDLNSILRMIKTSNFEERALALWDAEESLESVPK